MPLRFLITVKRSFVVPLAELFVSSLPSRKGNFVISHSEGKGKRSYCPDAWCKATHTWREVAYKSHLCSLSAAERHMTSRPKLFLPGIHLAAVAFPSSHSRKILIYSKVPNVHTNPRSSVCRISLFAVRTFHIQAYLTRL